MTRRSYAQDLAAYTIGLGGAALFTFAAFALVAWGGVERGTAVLVLTGLALVQVLWQLRFFLHVDLDPENRDTLVLIGFSVLILALMAAGTIWVLGNLQDRMMVMPAEMPAAMQGF